MTNKLLMMHDRVKVYPLMEYINLPDKVKFYLDFTFNTMRDFNHRQQVPRYLLNFKRAAELLYTVQKQGKEHGEPFPSIDPGSSDRRARRLSHFGIFHGEATRVGSSGLQSFSTCYPKLLLPHWNVQDGRAEFDQKNQAILKSFLANPELEDESNLRGQLWDPIFTHLFSNSIYGYRFQLKLQTVNERYHPLRLVDAYFGFRTTSSNAPLFLIEVDKHPLISGKDHKDFLKMATIMGASLKKLVGICRNQSLDFLRNLCVFGVLAGGTSFDLCAVYPDFGSASEDEFGEGKVIPNFAIIFRYSKENWRWNLFGDDGNGTTSSSLQDSAEYFNLESSSSSSSSGFIIKPAERPERTHGGTITANQQPNSAEFVDDTENELDYIDVDEEDEEDEDEISEIIGKTINIGSLQILIKLSDHLKEQADKINEIMNNDRLQELQREDVDDKFAYSEKMGKLIPRGRKTINQLSPSSQKSDPINP